MNMTKNIANQTNSQIEVGCGVSNLPNATAAGREAASMAMLPIRDHRPVMVIVYASVCYDLKLLLMGVSERVGDAKIVGTTTAGCLFGEMHEQSVVVCVLASAELAVHCAVGRGVTADWRRAVEEAMADPDIHPYFSLTSSQRQQQIAEGKTAFIMLFSPGNTKSSDTRSFEIAEQIKNRTLGVLPIFGGSSADDWRMEESSVILGDAAKASPGVPGSGPDPLHIVPRLYPAFRQELQS